MHNTAELEKLHFENLNTALSAPDICPLLSKPAKPEGNLQHPERSRPLGRGKGVPRTHPTPSVGDTLHTRSVSFPSGLDEEPSPLPQAPSYLPMPDISLTKKRLSSCKDRKG